MKSRIDDDRLELAAFPRRAHRRFQMHRVNAAVGSVAVPAHAGVLATLLARGDREQVRAPGAAPSIERPDLPAREALS